MGGQEVVQRALAHQAAAVVLAHNHPSGSVQPSNADIALTQTFKTSLALIDVRVLDHIGCSWFYSVLLRACLHRGYKCEAG